MWNIGPIKIQTILFIHRSMYKACPNEGLVVETEGGGKERKIVNKNRINDICVGTDTRKHTEDH
jgi:hypothetical protein